MRRDPHAANLSPASRPPTLDDVPIGPRQVAVALVAVAVSACATSRAPEPAPSEATVAPLASAAVRGLRILIAESVSVSGEGEIPSSFERELREAVQKQLVHQGLTVVTDPTAPHDLVARLSAHVRSAAYFVHGSVALSLEERGSIVAQVDTAPELYREDKFIAESSRKLVDALVRSPRLGSIAAATAGAARSAAPAAAPPRSPRSSRAGAVALARSHFNQGTSYYNLGRYREALAEFEAAYLAEPDPAFLFNVAQCHRKLGNASQAVQFYRTYLREEPKAPNRAEVERRIQELDAAAGNGAAQPR